MMQPLASPLGALTQSGSDFVIATLHLRGSLALILSIDAAIARVEDTNPEVRVSLPIPSQKEKKSLSHSGE